MTPHVSSFDGYLPTLGKIFRASLELQHILIGKCKAAHAQFFYQADAGGVVAA